MVGIQFKSNTGRIQKSNGRFLENVPEMEEETAREFADDLEETVKQSVREKFGRFTGRLHDNVEARRKGSTAGGARFEVNANAYSETGVNYAAWHEFATDSHFVPLTNDNSPIQRWAAQRGIDARGITVTPINQQEGSFMAPAVRDAIKKARRRMRSGRSAPSSGLQKAFQ